MSVYGKKYTFNGKTMFLSGWSKETGISLCTLRARLQKLGWSPEKAFTTRPIKRSAKIQMRNGTYSYSALSKMSPCGIRAGTVRDRIVTQHLTPEMAISVPSAKEGHTTNGIKRKPKLCVYPDCDNCPYEDCVAG